LDPDENTNQINNPNYRGVAERLKELLDQHRKET
jgi:hypothetical protein